MRFVLNILTVILVAALAGVAALWVRSYNATDAIESYRDVPPPALGHVKPWSQRERWREVSIRSYPGRFEVVSTESTIKGRRKGANHDPSKLPGAVVNGWTMTQRPGAATPGEEKGKPGALNRALGSWQLDFIRPYKFAQADYQEIRHVTGRGFAAPFWMVALALGALPALRLFNAVFRAGRAPFDLLGRRQDGAGLGGVLGAGGRLISAASLVLLVATAALGAVGRTVSLRLEGRAAGQANDHVIVASRDGLFARVSPAAAPTSTGRYQLTSQPSFGGGVPPAHAASGRVVVNHLGMVVASGTDSDAEEESDAGPGSGAGAEPGAESETDVDSDADSDADAGAGTGTDTDETPTRTRATNSRATAGSAVASTDEGAALPPEAEPTTEPAAAPDADADEAAPSPPSAALSAPVGGWVAFVPYWVAAAAFGLLPALQFVQHCRGPREQRRPRSFGGVMGVIGRGFNRPAH